MNNLTDKHTLTEDKQSHIENQRHFFQFYIFLSLSLSFTISRLKRTNIISVEDYDWGEMGEEYMEKVARGEG